MNLPPPICLKTQIGGSYSPVNRKLFPLKAALVAIGFSVRHPIGDRVVFDDGRWRATEAAHCIPPFAEIEHHYYRCIRDCDFHCVANFKDTAPGALGASAAAEVGYAMLHAKPIVLTDEIQCAPTVERALASLIQARRQLFHCIHFAPNWPQLKPSVFEALIGAVDYRLDIDAERTISRCVSQLLDGL